MVKKPSDTQSKPMVPAAEGGVRFLFEPDQNGAAMKKQDRHKGLRLAAAIALPVVTLGLQWMLWPWIDPFAWFLFFPTVFFSARLGGYYGGLFSTALSVAIVWYFFLPPQLSWEVENPFHFWSIGMFLFVGFLVSEAQTRLERANQTREEALEQARSAHAELARTNGELQELTHHLEERVADRTAALRDNEERLRLFIEHAPVALAMFDRDMRYLAVSRRWMADFKLGAGDILGRYHYELFPNLPEHWKQAHQRGLAGAIVREEEDSYVMPDGKEKWDRWEVRPWRQADGNVGGIIICAEDITVRKTHEREIERLNRINATLTQINQAIVRVQSREELARQVSRVAIEFGGFKLAWVGRHNAQTSEVEPLGWAGEPREFIHNFRHSSADNAEHPCLCTSAIRKNRSCVSNDLLAAPEVHDWLSAMKQAGIRAAAAFPIRVRGTVWGVFGVYAGEPDVFQDKEIALLEEAAMDVGYAIEHIENEGLRKQAEQLQLLSIEILNVLNQPLTLQETSKAILVLIKEGTGLDAVGIRLKDGEDFPYFSAAGFAEEFLLAENSLILRTESGSACRDGNGQLCLECTCGLVLAEKCGPPSEHVTAAGSVWTNNSIATVESLKGHDPRLNPRNRCLHEGFLSVALIPIRVQQQVIGLLHLNSRNKDRFTPEMIRFFEGLTGSFGIALERKRAELALRNSEYQLRNVLDTNPSIIFVKDRDSRILLANKALARFYGTTVEKLIGTLQSELHAGLGMPAEEIAGWLADDREVIDTGRTKTVEERSTWKDGSIHWYHTTKLPIALPDGRPGALVVSEDTTERKQAELALSASLARYRSLFENMLNGFAHHRMLYEGGKPSDYVYLDVNPAFEKLTGLKDVVGKKISEVIPGIREADPKLFEIYGRVVATGEPAFFETYVEAMRKWFAISVYRSAKEHFVTVFDLVTERKRAEAALRESEERYRLLAENTEDYIQLSDTKGRTLYLCPAYERRFGLTVADLHPGRSFPLHPDDQATVDRARARNLAGESTIVEYRNRDPAGNWVWLEGRCNPILGADGRIEKLLLVERDITDHKKMEQALRQSEEYFRGIFESASIGMAQADVHTGQWLRVNRKMCEITGYSEAELLRMRVSEITHPEDRAKDWDAFQCVVRGDVPNYRMEKRYRRKDGGLAWVNVNMTVIWDIAGQPVHTLATIEDITERKRLEEQRQVIEVHLRQQQRLEAIGTLAGGVAHEINNPINGIMNYAQLIQDRLPQESPLAEFTGEILRETQRVIGIVRSLLTFSRNEKQSHSPAHIVDIVEGTLSLIRTIIRHDHIVLSVNLAEHLPAIQCRSQQIQQVLMNLMTNARDALNERYPETDPDKILKLEAGLVDRDGRHWVRLTVEDHGTGIKPEVRERMFDPFFTTKPRDKGTGLGLSISHGIVKEHHGELNVESEPGKFTRISLELPVNNE